MQYISKLLCKWPTYIQYTFPGSVLISLEIASRDGVHPLYINIITCNCATLPFSQNIYICMHVSIRVPSIITQMYKNTS